LRLFKACFFEKKKQKTLENLIDKSLFASFSSEKEVLAFFSRTA
jgi:hypothetical protein